MKETKRKDIEKDKKENLVESSSKEKKKKKLSLEND
jgi:hypothetical protein